MLPLPACRHNNVLKHAPHTADVVMAEAWDRPYSREKAAFPAAWVRTAKFWPSVSRVDNVFGDRHLVARLPDTSPEVGHLDPQESLLSALFALISPFGHTARYCLNNMCCCHVKHAACCRCLRVPAAAAGTAYLKASSLHRCPDKACSMLLQQEVAEPMVASVGN